MPDFVAIRRVNHWHLATIDHHGDSTSFREGFQSFADVFLQRCEYLLAAFSVCSLGVFTLPLVLRFQLLKLIGFLLNRFRVSNGLSVTNFLCQRGYTRRDTIQVGLPWLEFTIQCGQQGAKSGDAILWIEKRIRINQRHFAIRNRAGALRSRRGSSWFLLC